LHTIPSFRRARCRIEGVHELALGISHAPQRCLTDLIPARSLIGDPGANRTNNLALVVELIRASRYNLDLARPKRGCLRPTS